MKKKLVTLALALTLCVSMGSTAMAAESPDANEVEASTGGINLGDGSTTTTNEAGSTITTSEDGKTKVEVTADGEVIITVQISDDASVEVKKGMDNALEKANEQQKEALNNYFPEGATVEVQNQKLQELFKAATGNTTTAENIASEIIEISVEGDFTGSVEVTIPYDVDKFGTITTENLGDYYLAHIKDDGTIEKIPLAIDENGNLVGTFTSFSPVVLMKVDAATVSEGTPNPTPTPTPTPTPAPTPTPVTITNAPNGPGTAPTTTSPKTGEGMGVLAAELMMMFSAIGLVAYVGKKRISR